MSETATHESVAVSRPLSAADLMSRKAAVLGARLAELIARTPAAREPAIAQALTFLSAMADATRDIADAPHRGHPLDRLARAISLSALETDLVILAGLADEHEGYATLLRALHPRSEPRATAGLAAQLFCPTLRDRTALRATLTGGAAARTALVTLGGDVPFFERDLELAAGVWLVLCGLDVYPPALRPVPIRTRAAGLDEWLQMPDARRAVQTIATGECGSVLVTGDSEMSAMKRAAVLAAAAGRRVVAFEIAPTAAPETAPLASIHALARDALPVFALVAGDAVSPPAPVPLDRLATPALLCVRRSTPAGAYGSLIAVDTPRLTAAARERMWRETLPELAGAARDLSARYAIEPAVAADIVDDLRARARMSGAPIDLPAVADGVRARCHPPATAGLKLARATAGWDRLVLRPDRKARLGEALDRLLHQGTVLDRWRFLDGRAGARGVRLLFSGPPGTGKTLSAEVLAHRLGVDLLVVDISRVVSKWIGETEKHLAEAFDAAEHTQAVLLFDEADALFGKRTEVSDAHDRYANLETAYLLSRLERFEGLAVLSTNLKQNIDAAFLRRVEFAIEFDEPTAIEREELWRCHLPPDAPLAPDVDLRELAAFYPIVGGLIRNASVSAAFLAAAAGTSIGRHHLVGAIRREYDKSAKAFPGVPPGVVPA
jgi:hypothetical protein